MQETLFNPPLWLPAIAIALGIAIFVYGNARLKTPIRNGGLAVFAVALIWCAAAYFVQTRVEQCIHRTNAIVAAVEAADWAKLGTLVDKSTIIDVQNRSIAGRESIVSSTQSTAAVYGLKSIRTYGTETVVGPNTVDVTFNALVEGVQPLTTVFRFEYEERSDGMLLSKIVPVRVGNMTMDQLQRSIR